MIVTPWREHQYVQGAMKGLIYSHEIETKMFQKSQGTPFWPQVLRRHESSKTHDRTEMIRVWLALKGFKIV